MSNKLPKQAFVALAAVGWADGTLKKSEAGALVEAAKKQGLAGEDLAAVEASSKAAVSLDAFDPAGMGEWEKVVTYALASWVAIIDGVESRSETAALKALGERLGLADAVRKRAAAAAFDISVLPLGNRPDKYDFDALVGRLREKLPKVGA
jgi:uncharacterized membrane protein YebE (DUF533 family)